jgi:FixJ family two-component response regulator
MPLIYVLSEERNVIRNIISILEKVDGNVLRSFTEPDELLNEIRTKKPDLLFVDLKVSKGELTGISLLDKFKRYNYNFPVVVVTTLNSIEAVKKAFQYDVIDYISIPFTPDEILEIFQKAIKISNEPTFNEKIKELKKRIEFMNKEDNKDLENQIKSLFYKNPSLPQPHYLYALFMKNKNPNIAIKNLKASLALDPNFKEAKYALDELENNK